MKNFLKALLNAFTVSDITATAAQAEAPKEVIPQAEVEAPKQPSAVMVALGDCNRIAEGSAIRAFLPTFLNKVMGINDDMPILFRRGDKVQPILNPSVDLMGKLNTECWNVNIEIDPRDQASALVFVMDQKVYEEIDLPVYPTLLIDLGKTEVMLVYRLDQVIDRAHNPKEYRARGVLEEVMHRKLQADIASHNYLPLAGFFRYPEKGIVRVARYSRAYSLNELISAFGAAQDIEKVIQAIPSANKETGEVQQSEAETVFNASFDELIANGPLSMYHASVAASRVAQGLEDAGVDEVTRQHYAIEFFARISVLEPQWTENEGISETDVIRIFANPKNVSVIKK